MNSSQDVLIPKLAVKTSIPIEKSLPFVRGETIDWKESFRYPIKACLEHEGCWSVNTNCCIPAHKVLDFNKLAKSKVYYHQRGHNDAEAWCFIARMDDGMYVYFRASCDYTGFDCQGGGELMYTHDNFNRFWSMFLDTIGRMTLMFGVLTDLREILYRIMNDIPDSELDIISHFIGGKPINFSGSNTTFIILDRLLRENIDVVVPNFFA